ncbi:hypothetical protein GCM10023224_04940 [Streptomonospora halophila]|uniref:Uncharacterized protein n=1 Tax=Streptomonospora halophila TaxID=427369 RepID=A0ABP9G4S5_9ACTN
MSEHVQPVEEPVFSPDYEQDQARLHQAAREREQDLSAKTVEEAAEERREPDLDEDGQPVPDADELQDPDDPVDEDEGLWDAIEGEEGDDGDR